MEKLDSLFENVRHIFHIRHRYGLAVILTKRIIS